MDVVSDYSGLTKIVHPLLWIFVLVCRKLSTNTDRIWPLLWHNETKTKRKFALQGQNNPS